MFAPSRCLKITIMKFVNICRQIIAEFHVYSRTVHNYVTKSLRNDEFEYLPAADRTDRSILGAVDSVCFRLRHLF
jgi:hypothetical protein